MTLSRETSEGIRIADSFRIFPLYAFSISILIVKSFCEMAQHLQQLPGVESVLSNRLCCQDLFEQFFGKQHQRGATNDNPNVQQFESNTSAIRVASSIALAPVRGNCRGTNSKKRPGELQVVSELNFPLPKRPRCKKRSILSPLVMQQQLNVQYELFMQSVIIYNHSYTVVAITKKHMQLNIIILSNALT